MTSAPISTADREKARENIAFAVCSREECLCETGEFELRCLTLGDTAREAVAGPLEARVVELEAALKDARETIAELHTEIAERGKAFELVNDQRLVSMARTEAAEARANEQAIVRDLLADRPQEGGADGR